MKDIPVLFKPNMIRAIDEDRKTQTRRLKFKVSVGGRLWIKEPHWMWGNYRWTGKHTKTGRRKMRFFEMSDDAHPVIFEPDKYGFAADFAVRGECIGYHARSPLFMPKKYARKWLMVTGVREERLQDITDNDAQAEGIFFTDYGKICFHPKPCPLPNKHEHHQQKNGWSHCESNSDDQCIGSPRFAFARLWNSINADRAPWDSNPWVWVIEFRRIDK